MSACNPIQQYGNALTRRHFFGQGAFGLGAAALASLLPSSSLRRQSRSAIPSPPAACPTCRTSPRRRSGRSTCS